MDGEGFDDLTRLLSLGSSRRAAVRAIAGGVGAVLAGKTGGATAAGCLRPGRPCRSGAPCCSGRCNRRTRRCLNCPAGQQLCNGACVSAAICCNGCAPNETCCSFPAGAQCLDLRNDANHCGTCSNSRCPGGAVCANGDCGLTCVGSGVCFAPDCTCSNRVGRAGKLCARLSPFTCDTVRICSSDADCGFRQACVDACGSATGVCADPCA